MRWAVCMSSPPTGTTAASCRPLQCSRCLVSQCRSFVIYPVLPKSESLQVMGDVVRLKTGLFSSTGPGTWNHGGLGSLLTSTFFPGAAAGDWARGCNPHHYYTAAWSESPGPHRDPSPTNKECETLASLTELLTNL